MSTYAKRGLATYMWLVVVVATPLLVWAANDAVAVVRRGLGPSLWVIIIIFSVVIVVGELRPIPISRGVDSGDEITVSTAFGFGLLLVAPVFAVVAAQTVGLVVDYIVNRRSPAKFAFNVAQYALAYLAARMVYASLASVPFTPDGSSSAQVAFGPALVAGLAFLLLNNLLVAIAVSLNVRLRLARVLVGDLKWQIATSAPLIGLGSLAAEAMRWTPLSIVLLLMPIAALHHTGTLMMRREHEARHDNLTGLANRSMLAAAATRALSESVGQSAMLLLDLDHFKDINDTLGHAVGDQMLVAVAQRLTAEAGADNLIARLGGDEFAVLAPGIDDREAAQELAERLCAAVRQPVVLNGVTLTVGCSVGIAFGPDGAPTISDLLRCSDVALYSAKAARGAVAVYDRHHDSHSAAHLGLHADLRAAIEDVDGDQMWVAFQPQFDLASHAVTGVECLARWEHPDLGLVAADVFVPIAESTSLIDLLLDRVLNTALAQLREWDERGLHLTASVNLSARQLSDIALPETVGRCLLRHAIAADRLILEVTESRLLSNPELSAHIVRELRRIGVQISIDDFGTGYSSLAHLQRLAVNELKIDKSFIAALAEEGNTALVRSTIDLGHNLGLRVVAEGVETAAMADQLSQMGCDMLQGYLVGRPVAADELPAFAVAPAIARLIGEPMTAAITVAEGGRLVQLADHRAFATVASTASSTATIQKAQ